MKKSKRYQLLETLPVNNDTYCDEMPSAGLVTMNGPNDPKPSLKLENGIVIEMDGKETKYFDIIDKFIASYAIDLKTCEEAMAYSSLQFAKDLVDINVPRREIIRLAAGMSPAKIVEVVSLLNPVELMMAVQKMKARRTPANQAHVCNRKEDPALLAADAAVAAASGFAEIETTVGVARLAPSSALGILIGSQIGRPGTLTQCAIEEGIELALGMRGFTTYAETLSVYGTEKVFRDGDDLPWSKMFLTSAYLSRGLKNRFTSGTGSECMMGEAEGKSMLYLEARCIALVKGSGTQGVQNGGIDGVYVTTALPAGQIAIMAENLIAMLWDLECATGCDALWSGSKVRNAAHVLPWVITGTDFIHSGFGATTVRDNNFGGSALNIEDLDDEMIIQRDFKIDCGLKGLTEGEHVELRAKAAGAIQALCKELNFPAYSDEQIEKVIYAHSSDDIERKMIDNIRMSEEIVKKNITIVDLIKASAKAGETELAINLLELLKQRISGDYLQTAAIFDSSFAAISAVNDKNDYQGPGTGYRVDGDRWKEICAIRQVTSADQLKAEQGGLEKQCLTQNFCELGEAKKGSNPEEVVVGISPAFGKGINYTLSGLSGAEALFEILAGIEEEGFRSRIIRIENEIDLGIIAKKASGLSGSGIGIGLQSKGTVMIHSAELSPLASLELLPIAPLITKKQYRQIGCNAALYARGKPADPVLLTWDYDALVAKTRAFPKVVILQKIERESCNENKNVSELAVEFKKGSSKNEQ